MTSTFVHKMRHIGGILEGYWRVLEGYWRGIGGILEVFILDVGTSCGTVHVNVGNHL